jgi:hypothetical protein
MREATLHRTQPTAAAIVVLKPLQIQVISAKSPKLPKVLTVAWALGCDRSFRWIPGTSMQNSNWHPGTVARLVKIV